jgi:nucleoid DNA-binding protein
VAALAALNRSGGPAGPAKTIAAFEFAPPLRFSAFSLTLLHAAFTVKHPRQACRCIGSFSKEKRNVTKKEIVKQISEELGLTQLKTKEIVQKTFDAIIETLLQEKRIELRNFGVFEVKRRKARKARNPRTGEKVDVEPKNVVTFKPGKEMEERVRKMTDVPDMTSEEEETGIEENNGVEDLAVSGAGAKSARSRKLS